MNIRTLSWKIEKDPNGKYIQERSPSVINDVWLRGQDPVHYIILTVNRNHLYMFDDVNIESDIVIEAIQDDVYLVKVQTFDLKGNYINSFQTYVKEKGIHFTPLPQTPSVTVLEMD